MSARTCLRRSAAAIVAAALVATGTTGTSTADEPAPDPTRSTGPGVYIVTLADAPSAVYNGGTPGYTPTRARGGHRFDHRRPSVTAYEKRLLASQDRLLSRLGDPAVLYQMATAVNGFAARLSGAQVKQLRAARGVALVERNTKQRLDTVATSDLLELGKVWSGHGGPENAGKGTVIGLIDSGIWPENPSFAGLPGSSTRTTAKLQGFHGTCRRAEQWNPQDCSDKVLAADFFVKGFGETNLAQSEFLSPRDGSGHGSHTASIAAGNADVAVEIEEQGFGTTSGMAPAAGIAAYKACWTAPNPGDDGCATADTVAAIDQAVADGVDVLNYAISGPPDTVADSVETAFLNAATGGVFVAASAGNDGPGEASVAHASPWVTTVGASTTHLYQGALRLGDGEEIIGAMVSDQSVRWSRIVLGSDVASATATRERARICEIDSLDPGRVENRIVVCDRGVTARVDKSAAVARAGGAGMVLANVNPDTQDPDFHDVPTVHLDAAAAADLRSYVRASKSSGRVATASLDAAGAERSRVPQVALFSSRGPTAVRGGDLVKPDLTAPGLGVVGAVAPPSSDGRLWDISSGTSMSTAHVAGLAAFIGGVNPQWTPARVKSAMMTTSSVLPGGGSPFTRGAGNIAPRDFLDPVLTYDTSPGEWSGFLDGRVRARDLNQPSIAIGNLTGRATVTRRVTNVSGRRDTFRASVTGLDGVDATVAPAEFTLAPKASRRFTVTFETEAAAGAPVGSYATGSLTWTGRANRARIPLAVRPELSAVPAEVAGSGRSGRLNVQGRAGRSGLIALQNTGLAGATPTPVSLVPGPFDPEAPTQDDDTLMTTVTVPGGTEVARFEMEANSEGDDLDLFAYLDGKLVAQAASGSADEQVTLLRPEAGSYDLYVSASSAANDTTSTGQLYTWVVTPGDGGNLRLEPELVRTRVGTPFGYRASWSDLDMTQRWLGAISYVGSDKPTLVSIK